MQANDTLIEPLITRHGIDPNVLNISGQTPLFYSLRTPACIKALIQNGADVNHKDRNGWTPLDDSFYKCIDYAIDPLLRAGANPFARMKGKTLLDKCTDLTK